MIPRSPRHRSCDTDSLAGRPNFLYASAVPLLSLANVRHAYGSVVILDGVTLAIEPGEKIGLVGRNGSGKTTLMRVILGKLTPDSGSVQFQRNARVGYLSQDPEFVAGDTLRDAAERAFAELHELHGEIQSVYDAMAEAGANELDRLLRRQAELEARIEAAGGYAIDHRIDAMLHGLGFTDDQFALPVDVLSGGQKGRLGLARLLLEAPDLLLLDEPTNHLDVEGRRWLESFLADEYTGAVVIVSHDRWLLDRVAERIAEVEAGQIRTYPGNYHKYLELRRERQETMARQRDKQLDRIRQEEQFIARYKTGQRAKQARGRQSRLDRYKRDELVERPMEMDVMKLNLPPAARSGDQVIVAEGITKAYDDKTLFRDLDLTIYRGDRVGVLGPNGVGKTTLLRALLGDEVPDAGTVRQGTRLNVGYYRQLHEHLDMSLTIWQYLQSVIVSLDGAVRASEQQARNLAGAFLFSGDEQDKTLGDVSGGERSRAVLAGLVAGAHNLLVLDEPSNHLDIPSAERLEQSLVKDGGYDGTLIVVTHDRALLDATCDRLLIFDGKGGVRQFPGHYSEWLEHESRASRPAPDKPRRDRAGARREAKAAPREDPNAADRPNRKLALSELEKRIERCETRIAAIDGELVDPNVYADGNRSKKLQAERKALVDEKTPLEEEWSLRAESG